MRPPEQRIGQLLGGKYRLQELLALGGMGLVYGARHEATGRAVAIKLMRPELAGRPDLVRRVSAEARLAVEASHPNVVEVLDAGTDTFDVPYLILERLYGHTLDALIDAPLSVVTVAQALVPVLNALSALHQLGIVHRDLKPSNIFLSQGPGGRITPKLLDFGIAKALESAGATVSGTALGTPAYMAPEQALGCHSLGPSTDVWAIGVVFVRCLTGRLPFEDAASGGIGRLRPGLRAADLQGVPEPMARVLARALQLEPGERPASMAQFRNDLLAALRELDPGQLWPDETTVSYAPHESALASALSGVNAPADSVEAVEPGALKARVRVRRERTSTLSKLSFTNAMVGSRARQLRLPLLLLLPVGGASIWFASWARHAAESPGSAVPLAAASVPAELSTAPLSLVHPPLDVPSGTREASSHSGSPLDPALISVDSGARGTLSASPRGLTPSGVAAPRERSQPTTPTGKAPETELRASEAPPRVGANRSPIIEWSAQN